MKRAAEAFGCLAIVDTLLLGGFALRMGTGVVESIAIVGPAHSRVGLQWTFIFNSRALHVVEFVLVQVALRVLLLNTAILPKLVEVEFALGDLGWDVIVAGFQNVVSRTVELITDILFVVILI